MRNQVFLHTLLKYLDGQLKHDRQVTVAANRQINGKCLGQARCLGDQGGKGPEGWVTHPNWYIEPVVKLRLYLNRWTKYQVFGTIQRDLARLTVYRSLIGSPVDMLYGSTVSALIQPARKFYKFTHFVYAKVFWREGVRKLTYRLGFTSLFNLHNTLAVIACLHSICPLLC